MLILQISQSYWHSLKQVVFRLSPNIEVMIVKNCLRYGTSNASACLCLRHRKWQRNMNLASISTGKVAEQRKVTIESKAPSLIAYSEVYSSQISQICSGWKLLPLTWLLPNNLQTEFTLYLPTFSCLTISLQVSTGMHRKWVKMTSKTLFPTLRQWATAGSLSHLLASIWMPL